MRKKIIATVIAGAVLSTGILGLTACNSGNVNLTINKGEEVTAEGWANAFAATLTDNENYSGECALTSNVAVTGTSDEEAISYEMKLTQSGRTDYDKANDKLYFDTFMSMNGKIADGDKKTNGSYDTKSKSYYELKEKNGEAKKYWHASYSYLDSKTSGDEESREFREYGWHAESTSYISTGYGVIAPSAVNSTAFYETKDATVSTSIALLYEKFTYADGVYTANLWMKQDVEGLNFPELAIEGIVSVSIKNEKIVGYQVSVDYKDTLEATAEEKEMGIDYSIEYHVVSKTTYNFSYGDTTVTAPADAAKAIERAAEREKDNND